MNSLYPSSGSHMTPFLKPDPYKYNPYTFNIISDFKPFLSKDASNFKLSTDCCIFLAVIYLKQFKNISE
jgi:hypothetical protein